jgi:uncharacterized cupredoxin-like copper-binding protein
MEFWRRGSARSARPSAAPRKQIGTWQRITGLHFPAWVPVAGIIAVVFGILGGLFVIRGATGAPRISDHWHARYSFTACGERQPNAPTWESGVHTHADGIIHIHPFQAYEEGSGSRLAKWFEYGGGELTNSKIRMPGVSRDDQDRTWENGETCSDGAEGQLQVFVTSTGQAERKVENFTRLVPQDGDFVRIVFGPVESAPVVQQDRTIITEEPKATHTINVTDQGTDATSKFEPNRISINAGEAVKIVIKNIGQISHSFRVRGVDGEYNTADDFVVTPSGEDPATTGGILQPNAEGEAIVKFDTGGVEIEFRDDTLNQVTGTLVVGEPVASASPSPTPGPAGVDAEVSVTMSDTAFDPGTLPVPAAKRFRINITNNGTLACDVRIAGPDGEFRTDDDIVSQAVPPGGTGSVDGQIDTPGDYAFQCSFRPELSGTLKVE